MQSPGYAFVCAPGAISFPPKAQLAPDILVIPARYPISERWADTTEHWLAVEILSRSSRVYDREFKRDAYLTLGVREVWLVDRWDRSVEVSCIGGTSETVRNVLHWRVPTVDLTVRVELDVVFMGIE
ncbi:MAG: Uma2 family endonuclease [bacterium]